jgi:hypothetical protein
MGKQHDIDQLALWKKWLFLIKLGFGLIVLLLVYVIAGDILGELTSDFVDGLNPKGAFIALEKKDSEKEIIDGIHIPTGLAYGKGYTIVKATCLSCHSSKLITQNRATRDGWAEMIRWMQKTQGLPSLGNKESIILDYLAKHYAPTENGRRKGLDTTQFEWYILEL